MEKLSEQEFKEIYELEKFQEDTGEEFANDAINQFGTNINTNTVSEKDMWNWCIYRLADELNTESVRLNGYLERYTWEQFYKNFNEMLLQSELLQNCSGEVKRFYKTLFRYYLRILWSFSAIKDEELLDLKTKYLNTKMDKMFQNTMINGDTVKLVTPDKVSEILHPWLIRKQES